MTILLITLPITDFNSKCLLIRVNLYVCVCVGGCNITFSNVIGKVVISKVIISIVSV